MGLVGIIGRIGLAAALLGASGVAAAQTREPLVVTNMADPDPDFVPPSSDRSRTASRVAETPDDDAQIDQAMQDLGNAIGAVARVEQEQIAAKCREAQPQDITPEQRFAWAASCRYSRR